MSFMIWMNTFFAYAEEDDKCENWIKLNTSIPFVWNCISTKDGSSTNQINAFPKLMWAMMNIVMTIILLLSFILIIYAGILLTTEWINQWASREAIATIEKVAKGLALLWASWVILKIINPNFFM